MEDVSKYNFSFYLPTIIRDLSTCSFVSLDLEFSGIPTRKGGPSGKQTLQARYTEAKEAAEKYQILQIGLTIAREHASTGESSSKFLETA
jgi:poly(A)-specific ribonuclease